MGLFKRKRMTPSIDNTRLKFINDFEATFTDFGGDVYSNDVVRSSIHAIATNAAKLNIEHQGSAKFNNIVLTSPNSYMNSYDFIYKVVSQLYTKNNVFIEIVRDMITGTVIELKPINYQQAKFSKDGTFIYFTLADGRQVYEEYSKLIHLRRHFNDKELYGSNNYDPLETTLNVNHTVNEGIINSVKASARLRGLLKFSQTLRPEDLKKQKDEFAKDYLGSDNDGGVAALDAKADFIELKSDIKLIDDNQMKTVRDNIYRYFGVSENIVKSSYTEDEYNSFYSSVIEPIAIQMSLEFTRKIFTEKEISFGNKILFSAERLTFANNSTKASLINTLLPLGVISINEARTILELSPIDEGDKHLVSLNYVDLSKANEYQLGEKEVENEGEQSTDQPTGDKEK